MACAITLNEKPMDHVTIDIFTSENELSVFIEGELIATVDDDNCPFGSIELFKESLIEGGQYE